jgi:hypothetical protein
VRSRAELIVENQLLRQRRAAQAWNPSCQEQHPALHADGP